MGVLVSLKQPIFRQGNKLSKDPIYPMMLTEIEIIDSISMEVIDAKSSV